MVAAMVVVSFPFLLALNNGLVIGAVLAVVAVVVVAAVVVDDIVEVVIGVTSGAIWTEAFTSDNRSLSSEAASPVMKNSRL